MGANIFDWKIKIDLKNCSEPKNRIILDTYIFRWIEKTRYERVKVYKSLKQSLILENIQYDKSGNILAIYRMRRDIILGQFLGGNEAI